MFNANQVKEILTNWNPAHESDWPVIDADGDLVGRLDRDQDIIDNEGRCQRGETVLADLRDGKPYIKDNYSNEFAMTIEDAWDFIPGPEFKVLDVDGSWTGEGTFKCIPGGDRVIYQDNTNGFELGYGADFRHVEEMTVNA